MALSKIDPNSFDVNSIGQYGGRRNLIINGAMQVAQRGTSATSSNGLYPTDRWRTYSNSSDYSMQQYTMTQSDVNSTGQTKGLRVTLSTAENPIGSTNYVSVVTKLEGQDLQQLKYGGSSAKTVTLSFWAKSNKTGTYTIWLQITSDGTAQRIIKEYSINSSDTWEYKTISIVGNTANNIVDTDGLGLQVGFNFAWGSTYDGGTADTWFNTSDGHFSTSNQVNFMDNTSNEFIFSGVQLEVGSVATPFEHRSFGEEQLLCQRYLQKQEETGDALIFAGKGQGDTQLDFGWPLSVPLRVSPTITQSGTGWRGFRPTSNLVQSSATATVLRFHKEHSFIALRVASFPGGSFTNNYAVNIGPVALSYIYFDSEL